jgi:hypothetical protein
MPHTKVICPHCSKRLKTSKPLTAGHRVLCSGCGLSFAVQPPAAALGANSRREIVTAAGSTPADASKPVVRRHAAHVTTVPNTSAASRRQPLWIGLVLGSLLLLAGATVGLTLYFAMRTEPAETPEPVSDSLPSQPGAVAIDPPAADSELLPVDRVDPTPRPAPRNVPPPSTPPLSPTPPAEPKDDAIAWLPPKEQETVNKAIDIGVQWLKNTQSENGHWGFDQYPVGLAALPALTLLECGVPGDNRHIQKALAHVREGIPRLTKTYELALAILFLDRLGDPDDVKWIRTCALRLVAGQKPSGGWTYDCPRLKGQQESDLLTVMRYRRPKKTPDLFVVGPNGSFPPGFIAQGSDAPLDKPMDKDVPSEETYKKALKDLPANLRQLPALQPPSESHKLSKAKRDKTDNSNTQFATLALSAAARHDLPLERALALIAVRFHKSQVPSGGWNYHFSTPAKAEDVRPAMAGCGLLGLAVGLGLVADQTRTQSAPRHIQDPAIEKGFDYLGSFIGEPLSASDAQINLYTLWTIERCGVLYNRRQIGGKEWYPWGVQLLLQSQKGDGSWNHGHYFTSPPSITPITDTCFALLFLKRANLAKHLTKKLEFIMERKPLQER